MCPLSRVKNRNPQMDPTGAVRPDVYFLGEGPGADEDRRGRPFVGPSREMLRAPVPRRFRDRVRYSNVVRTRPFKNATPDAVSIECCRPSVVSDIEWSRPRAVVGLGNVPLEWVSGFTGITAWRGRRMPVRIGSHLCWYYPILHPAAILHKRKVSDRAADDEEFIFNLDVARVFREVESLPDPVVHDVDRALADTEIVSGHDAGDLDRVADALRWAAALPVVGRDYETRGLRPYASDAVVLSTSVSDGVRSVAFPIDHPGSGWTDDQKVAVRDLWRRFLLEARGVKVAHNEAFELEWDGVFFGADTVRAGHHACTRVQASVLDERSRGGRKGEGPQSLAFLTQQYFGVSVKSVVPVDVERLYDTPLEVVLRYNCPDAKYAALLYREQRRELRRQNLGAVYDLSIRRVPTVVLSQMRGVPVSQPAVAKLISKYDAMAGADDNWAAGGVGWRSGSIGRQIAELDVVKEYESRHGGYNPMSSRDALRVFHEMLGCGECEVQDKRTGRARLSVDESVLAQIDHPLARLTLDLRRVCKLRSTYALPLRAGGPSSLIYPDGLLHCVFNTTLARTGRLSCEGPNLQNVPKRTAEGKEIRSAFVAALGELIVAADYGQIEARVIAMLTRDPKFCRALWERYDVHMEWAERVARAYPECVGGRKNLVGFKLIKDPRNKDREEVRAAKKLRGNIKSLWTFPLFFGASLRAVADYIRTPESVLRPLYDDFWEEFSAVHDWQRGLVKFYEAHGYVEGPTGRRRHGPLTYNEIINSPVQGGAAEIVMDGMSRLSETGDSELQPEINIHDDLTYMRVRESRVDEVVEKIVTHMLDVPFDFVNVPITIEVSVGKNWMNMEEIGAFSSDDWFAGGAT